MMRSLLIIVLAVMTLLTGCREDFEIKVSQVPGQPPTLGFKSRGIFGGSMVEIRQLSVGRVVAQAKPHELVWAIQTKLETPKPIAEITYGIVPEGFEEFIPAQRLLVGERYDIIAGKPGSIGGAVFTKE
jgi:hypothetical protein